MKTLLAIALSLLTFSCLAAEKEDPIVGKWRWFDKQVITVTADGRASASRGAGGTWEFTNNKEVERKYALKWNERAGFAIDVLTLSRDGKQLTGKNDAGEKISAKRMAQ